MNVEKVQKYLKIVEHNFFDHFYHCFNSLFYDKRIRKKRFAILLNA